jgi:DNA processing protein
VGVVPGSIFSPVSQGCNSLIKQGAVVICSAADLAQELGFNEAVDASCDVVSLPVASSDLGKERDLLHFLAKMPRSEDEIASFLVKELSEVQQILFDLQLDGKITQHFTGLWGFVG